MLISNQNQKNLEMHKKTVWKEEKMHIEETNYTFGIW